MLVRAARLAGADWEPFLVSLLLAGLGGAAVALIVSALLARLDQRTFAVDREPVNLVAVAQRAQERAAAQARELGVALDLRAPGEGAWGLGDDGRVLQAVSNLVDNALRATPRGGRVTIEPSAGAITVRDTGPGLDPEDLPRAFDRFHLHAKYGADRLVGSGQGMASVRELARTMGGDATVSSRRGEGAAFTVRLPPATRPST